MEAVAVTVATMECLVMPVTAQDHRALMASQETEPVSVMEVDLDQTVLECVLVTTQMSAMMDWMEMEAVHVPMISMEVIAL